MQPYLFRIDMIMVATNIFDANFSLWKYTADIIVQGSYLICISIVQYPTRTDILPTWLEGIKKNLSSTDSIKKMHVDT